MKSLSSFFLSPIANQKCTQQNKLPSIFNNFRIKFLFFPASRAQHKSLQNYHIFICALRANQEYFTIGRFSIKSSNLLERYQLIWERSCLIHYLLKSLLPGPIIQCQPEILQMLSNSATRMVVPGYRVAHFFFYTV